MYNQLQLHNIAVTLLVHHPLLNIQKAFNFINSLRPERRIWMKMQSYEFWNKMVFVEIYCSLFVSRQQEAVRRIILLQFSLIF